MGSFCSPSPQVQNTQQQQTYQANPAIQGAGIQALSQAQSAASSPFQMPAAPVAGFTPFQQQSFNQYQGLQGGTNPFFNEATGEQNLGQQPVSQSDIQSNMNPFAQGALSDLKKYVFDPQRTQTMGNAVQTAGGQSADRLALTSQNLDKTQGDTLSQAESGFYSQAYSQAAAAKQQALQSAQGWANLGIGQQGAQLQATGALAGAGAQQQALSQAQLNSPYQQQLAQIAYPFQTAQFLAGITGGLSPAFGGTTSGQSNTTTTPSQPSLLNQILGGGMSAVGLAGGLGAFGGSSPNLYGGGVSSGGNNGQPVFAYAGGGSIDEPDDIVPGAGRNPFEGIIPEENLTPGSYPTPMKFQTPAPLPSSGSGGGSGGGMDIGKMAQMAMMFMAGGGTVDPSDAGMGYDDGGMTPAEIVDERFANPYLGSDQYQNMGANSEALKAYGRGRMSPGAPSPFDSIDTAGGSGFAQPQGLPPGATSYDMLDDPGVAGSRLPQRPRITVNAAPRPQAPPQPQVPLPLPRPQIDRPQPAPDPSIDSHVTDDGLMIPRSSFPYPDALDRNSGQDLTRSPWTALINAGAKTMQSLKGGIGGFGEGIEAGTKTLADQRKELRSEEAINQRAEALHRQAKAELDKYNKTTPYQQALIDQGRYTWQSGTGKHPETGEMTSGVYRLPARGGEDPKFYPDVNVAGKNGKPSVYETKKNDWIALHPNDTEGAMDYAMGRKTMTTADVANRSAQRAEQDATGNPLITSAQQREEYLKERLEYWKSFYQENNRIR